MIPKWLFADPESEQYPVQILNSSLYFPLSVWAECALATVPSTDSLFYLLNVLNLWHLFLKVLHVIELTNKVPIYVFACPFFFF